MLKPSNPAGLCCFVFVVCLQTTIAKAEYQAGTLVSIEKKVKITPIDYIYETVVSYYETVTYELQIRVGNDVYFTDYTPGVQPNWPLPSEWKPNVPVQLRLEKHRLLVKLKLDGEIVTYINRRSHTKSP